MKGAVRREYHRWLSPEADNRDHEIRPAQPDLEPVDPEILEEVVIDRLAPWGDGAVGILVAEPDAGAAAHRPPPLRRGRPARRHRSRDRDDHLGCEPAPPHSPLPRRGSAACLT